VHQLLRVVVLMTIFRSRKLALFLISLLATGPTFAGEADVVDARVTRANDGTYRFDVSVLHADEGWDHYANAFEILDADGNVLGTRTLLHPHVGEQPFTRSLTGVHIPEGLTKVTARANDSVHGTGGRELVLDIPQN